jgi:hypothetical protein
MSVPLPKASHKLLMWLRGTMSTYGTLQHHPGCAGPTFGWIRHFKGSTRTTSACIEDMATRRVATTALKCCI